MAFQHKSPDATDTSPMQAKSQKTEQSFDEEPPPTRPDLSIVASPESPFRFLDLPRELRYMVYERISFETSRHELKDFEWIPGRWEMRDSHPMPEWVCDDTMMSDHPSMILVTKSLPVAILASCRLINAEARRFLAPKLALLQDSERFHFNIHVDAIDTFFALHNDDTTQDGVSSYTLYNKTYTQDSPEYPEIDSFVRKASSLAYRGFPRTTSIAIRYSDQYNHDEQEEDLDDTRRRARDIRLSQFIPGIIRICHVRELIEEDREEQPSQEKCSSNAETKG
jgi:hypothetical protein